MTRTLLAVLPCAGLASTPAFAAGPQSVDSLLGHYDASDVAEGTIQVNTAGDLVYVSGTSRGGPWLDVWRRTAGRWTMIAEIGVTELAPIRFGAKRDRVCRRTS